MAAINPSAPSSNAGFKPIVIDVFDAQGSLVQGRTLSIEQNGTTLEITVCTDIDEECMYEVESKKIKGLPADRPVPKEFFASCQARVLGKAPSFGVLFRGVQAPPAPVDNPVSLWPQQAFEDVPTDIKDLAKFYSMPAVRDYQMEQIKGITEFLNQIQTAVFSGATGLEVAFLAVSNFGYAGPMQSLKNRYRDLAQSLSINFGSIQANNIRILDAFATANRRLPAQDIHYILSALEPVAERAAQNATLCSALQTEAEALRQTIQTEATSFSGRRDSFKKLKETQKQAEEKLRLLREQIASSEQDLAGEFAKLTNLDIAQSRATVAKYTTLGLFHLFGGKTDYSQDRRALEVKLAHHESLLSQQRLLEQTRVNELRQAKEHLLEQINGLGGRGMTQDQARALFIAALGVVIPGLEHVGKGLSNLAVLFHNFIEVTQLGKEKALSLQGQHTVAGQLSFPEARIVSFLVEFKMTCLCWLAVASQGNRTHKALEMARVQAFDVLQLTEPDFSKHLELAKQKLQQAALPAPGPQVDPGPRIEELP